MKVGTRTIHPWLLAIVLMFCVVFIVNGLLVHFAVTSFNGTVTADAYQKGLRYNQVLQTQVQQQQLGWQVHLGPTKWQALVPGVLQLEITDQKGVAIANAEVNVLLWRPVVGGLDLNIRLVQSRLGIYTANMTPPAKGKWELRIKIKSGTEELDHVMALWVEASI